MRNTRDFVNREILLAIEARIRHSKGAVFVALLAMITSEHRGPQYRSQHPSVVSRVFRSFISVVSYDVQSRLDQDGATQRKGRKSTCRRRHDT